MYKRQEYFPVSSVNPDIEVTKATISNTNETKNSAIRAEFPTIAGRTKMNNDNKSVMKENVAEIFFAMIKQTILHL